MVTVGCFSAEEAQEDINISLAALGQQELQLGIRHSPNPNQAAFGKTE